MNTMNWIVLLWAIVWAVTILAVAWTLRGVPQANQVIVILGGASAATLILLGGRCRRPRDKEQTR